jgi:hypothetical protein
MFRLVKSEMRIGRGLVLCGHYFDWTCLLKHIPACADRERISFVSHFLATTVHQSRHASSELPSHAFTSPHRDDGAVAAGRDLAASAHPGAAERARSERALTAGPATYGRRQRRRRNEN